MVCGVRVAFVRAEAGFREPSLDGYDLYSFNAAVEVRRPKKKKLKGRAHDELEG